MIGKFSFKLNLILAAALIVVGVVISGIAFGIPLINKQYQSQVIYNYNSEVASMSAEEIQEAKEAAKQYNLTGKGNYYVASGEDRVISFIEIPKIDVYLPIFDSSDEESLGRGIGMLENSSYPIGGKGTNCILTGHSGLISQPMFTNLTKLETSDRFYLHTLDEELCYQVSDISIYEPQEVADHITFSLDKDLCTLVTCTPIGTNTHRLVITGERVENYSREEETQAATEIVQATTSPKVNISATAPESNKPETTAVTSYDVGLVVCGIISAGFVVMGTGMLVFSISKERKKRKDDTQDSEDSEEEKKSERNEENS